MCCKNLGHRPDVVGDALPHRRRLALEPAVKEGVAHRSFETLAELEVVRDDFAKQVVECACGLREVAKALRRSPPASPSPGAPR